MEKASKVITLENGGQMALSLNLDLFELKGEERIFVFGLIDTFNAYSEKQLQLQPPVVDAKLEVKELPAPQNLCDCGKVKSHLGRCSARLPNQKIIASKPSPKTVCPNCNGTKAIQAKRCKKCFREKLNSDRQNGNGNRSAELKQFRQQAKENYQAAQDTNPDLLDIQYERVNGSAGPQYVGKAKAKLLETGFEIYAERFFAEGAILCVRLVLGEVRFIGNVKVITNTDSYCLTQFTELTDEDRQQLQTITEMLANAA